MSDRRISRREAVSRMARAGAGALGVSALPVLARAEATTIAYIGTGAKTGPGPEALARKLAAHGVDAEIAQIAPAGAAIAEALVAAAAAAQSDLLVTGAYSHSRAREVVLGGVTGELLNACPLPLLMAH